MDKIEVKKCKRCYEVKGLSEFYDKSRSQCVPCERESARKRMKRYNSTFRGKASRALQDSRSTVKKLRRQGVDITDDLTLHDVLFTFAIADGRCQYCGEYHADRLQLEHIVPLSSGGANSFHNVTAVCGSCNRSKNNTPLIKWHESPTNRRSVNEGILSTIDSMALRRGVAHGLIIDELQGGGGERR